MTKIVVDASALLALLNSEAGADVVAESIPEAVISAVNLSEVVGKLCAAGMPEEAIRQALQGLDLEVIPFDEEQAYGAGLLRSVTDDKGLSLGDRACLNMARRLGIPALTADRIWKELSMGTDVRLIR
ncbi:MAG: type II toxin-antitoxin system VapC family toxin [Dehalococcoidia bacterium]|nr:type II toxin-antitoxin system VapC family toxin [Dehalococcoidia bacterium]